MPFHRRHPWYHRDVVPVFLWMGIHLVFFQCPTPGHLPHLLCLLHFPCLPCLLLSLTLCLFPCLLFMHPLCHLLQRPLGPCPSKRLPLPHQLLGSFLLRCQKFVFNARSSFHGGFIWVGRHVFEVLEENSILAI